MNCSVIREFNSETVVCRLNHVIDRTYMTREKKTTKNQQIVWWSSMEGWYLSACDIRNIATGEWEL